jgi:Putative prokaryotic signal transducing protein
MRTVATFSTPAEAHVALASLTSAGIHAALRDEFTVTFNWLLSNAIGGVKIEVEDEEEADAREILAMPLRGEGSLRCPYCGSSDARVRVLSVFGAVCMGLNLPIPMTRAMVDCRTCQKTYDVPIDGKGT